MVCFEKLFSFQSKVKSVCNSEPGQRSRGCKELYDGILRALSPLDLPKQPLSNPNRQYLLQWPILVVEQVFF